MHDAARFILMYVVFPVWVAAGFVDWMCHRHTDIEHTSGVEENLLHWTMYTEIGIGMLAVAFCEVNAMVLCIVVAVFVAHELTVYWDLHYTTGEGKDVVMPGSTRHPGAAYSPRHIGPFEQMVHSFLEQMPLASLALLAAMSWPQVLAIFGLGRESPDWSLHAKAQPLSMDYLVAAAAATALFNALPLAEETIRCAMFRTRRSPAPR